MRALKLGLLFWATACGAPPPVAAPAPKPAALAPKVEAAEPEPAPEPLASESIEYEQKGVFVELGLGTLKPPLMPEAELIKRLPANARTQYQSVSRARAASLSAQRKQSAALYARTACEEDCSEDKALIARYKSAVRAATVAEDKLDRTYAQATQVLEKLQSGASPAPEVGIALARLYARGSGLDEETSFERRAVYGAPEGGRATDSKAAIPPLERALDLAAPADDTGVWVRLELVHHLMATERAQEAERVLTALETSSPADLRAEVLARRAILRGRAGDHTTAAKLFRDARSAVSDTSSISRMFVLSGELAASYRAKRFDRVLELASEAWDEHGKPPPPKPAPPAPPPKPQKKPAKRVQSAGILSLLGSDPGNFGILGVLSGSSEIGDDTILRLAADAVERADQDAEKIQGASTFRAGLLARLAVRALYRNDSASARRHAEASIRVGTGAARDAYRVLEVLEKRAGNAARVTELEKQRGQLGYERGGYGSEPEHELLSSSSSRKPELTATERNVRSLMRLCLEPVHLLLPAARAGKKVIATLELKAEVFATGQVTAKASADDQSDAVREVVRCLTEMAPEVLASAPASIHAKIALDDSVRRSDDSIFGSLLGEGFGGLGSGEGIGTIGGLGLRGTGPGGGGTGIGVGGLIGGSGTGSGYGTGRSKLPAKKAPAPPKKP